MMMMMMTFTKCIQQNVLTLHKKKPGCRFLVCVQNVCKTLWFCECEKHSLAWMLTISSQWLLTNIKVTLQGKVSQPALSLCSTAHSLQRIFLNMFLHACLQTTCVRWIARGYLVTQLAVREAWGKGLLWNLEKGNCPLFKKRCIEIYKPQK